MLARFTFSVIVPKYGEKRMELKGTLMQIWKSANIFVLKWKWYAEDVTLKHLLHFQICTSEICKMFVYKHSETIEYVKTELTSTEIYKLHRQITREFLGLRKQNFKGIAFI